MCVEIPDFKEEFNSLNYVMEEPTGFLCMRHAKIHYLDYCDYKLNVADDTLCRSFLR